MTIRELCEIIPQNIYVRIFNYRDMEIARMTSSKCVNRCSYADKNVTKIDFEYHPTDGKIVTLYIKDLKLTLPEVKILQNQITLFLGEGIGIPFAKSILTRSIMDEIISKIIQSDNFLNEGKYTDDDIRSAIGEVLKERLGL